MKLVLTEKQSVAQSIAKVIHRTKRYDSYFEGGGYVMSWCFGHLVELANFEGCYEKYGKWKYEDYHIILTRCCNFNITV